MDTSNIANINFNVPLRLQDAGILILVGKFKFQSMFFFSLLVNACVFRRKKVIEGRSEKSYNRGFILPLQLLLIGVLP